MQQLTEQQIVNREIEFFELIETVVPKYYNIPEDYKMTEADAYITAIVLEHFIQNYKETIITENLLENYSIDVNQALYDDIAELMLDEGIGKYIAGAYLGAKRAVDRAKYNLAKGVTASLSKRVSDARAAAAETSKKAKSPPQGTGFSSSFIRGLSKGRAEKAAERLDKLQTKHSIARTNRNYLQNPLKASTATREKKKAELAAKIDAGISNVGKNVRKKIDAGVTRLGSAIGRFA